jgi:acetylornithine deacetylase/succinyl-diaminopimelate desuccinylase-like protein
MENPSEHQPNMYARLLAHTGRHAARLATITGLVVVTAGTVAAQGVIPSEDPGIKRALAAIQSWNAWIVENQVSICEIPAPPFKEQARGVEFRKRMIALGYPNTRIDTAGNVIAERAGKGGGPTVMISGHLDTVFPEGTDVKVKKTGERYTGAGIGDDCRGLATILAIARALNEAKIETRGKVILVANVGEEGPGNLRGVRELLTHGYKGQVDRYISVDGTGFGITARAVGSKRYNVVFTGPGGHSYGAFGNVPSAIHAMGRAIANIGDLVPPAGIKTTFNVGVVKGGTSVNTISPDAAMEVDMRSESVGNLDEMERLIKDAIAKGVTAENARWARAPGKITVKYDTIGIRPVGAVPQTDSTPIIRTALEAARALGVDARTGASSTDSNLPMSMGIPAMTIDGGGRGGNAHAAGEWYEDGPNGYKGPQWALLIVTALAGLAGSTTP